MGRERIAGGPGQRMLSVVLAAVLLLASAGAAAKSTEMVEPVVRPGLPNLFRVGPVLYRAAQPTAEGFRNLREMGVKTVVNLRSMHGDAELIEGTGLKEVRIRSNAASLGEDEIVRFLRAATDPANQPVLVHCAHGADRTGAAVGAWRIVVQGWPKERASREMREGGFGCHEAFTNLPRMLRGLDVEKVRREAGLEGSAEGVVPAVVPATP